MRYFRHEAPEREHLPLVAEATWCLSNQIHGCFATQFQRKTSSAVGELSAEGVWVVLF